MMPDRETILKPVKKLKNTLQAPEDHDGYKLQYTLTTDQADDQVTSQLKRFVRALTLICPNGFIGSCSYAEFYRNSTGSFHPL